MMKKVWLLILFCLIAALSKAQEIVLISKDKNQNIQKWLLRNDKSIITKEFYFLSPDSQQYFLEKSSGILIGGGEDIHPKLYNNENEISDCGKIDQYRDSIEYVLINYAIKNKIPLLGICRGQQIINVATGGTLIVDIPKAIHSTVNHNFSGDSAHWVFVNNKSRLHTLLQCDSLMVNSSHHQAVKKVSDKFNIVATAADGIVESIEWKDSSHPFASAIQWHPEKLNNDPSDNLCKSFLFAVKKR